MITSENLNAHEFIGLQTEIKESSNLQIVGLSGVIVDETKHMFLLQTKNGLKDIPKNHNKWGIFPAW